MNGKVLLLKFALVAAVLSATGCGKVTTLSPSPTPGSAPTDLQASNEASSTEERVVVAFVKDGNIQLWDGSTGQIQTIVNAGDVIAVTMSDDGQVIAFLRRSVVQLAENEWYEQSALLAVDRNGGNLRELVSAESLRQRLNAGEKDSTNIPQMEWIPGTHQLLFSGWTYLVQAEGESHAVPRGLYIVDADTRTDKMLVSEVNNLRFVPSPDGRQVALMSPNALSFINVDGSNQRQDVLTYPSVGLTAPFFPTGVWTQDSSAFLITGSLENDPAYNINFTIWRVPVDGSSPESLATVTKSDPRSATFSPDGTRMAFLQATDGQPPTIAGWFIMPLAGNARPLAIPSNFETWVANLHWSPAGDPFTGNLKKLCPEATSDADICDDRIHFDGTVVAVHWIDGNRVLFLTRNPSVLFLGSMDFAGNLDGTTIPIVAWPVADWVSPMSFAMAEVSR
jgi:WD40 repeat protein